MIIDETQQPLAICGWGCGQVSLQQIPKNNKWKREKNISMEINGIPQKALIYLFSFTKDQPASHKSFIVALLFSFLRTLTRDTLAQAPAQPHGDLLYTISLRDTFMCLPVQRSPSHANL